jgi:hypothetical protein
MFGGPWPLPAPPGSASVRGDHHCDVADYRNEVGDSGGSLDDVGCSLNGSLSGSAVARHGSLDGSYVLESELSEVDSRIAG